MLCLQVGGIGAGAGKVSVIQQINHQGEVNRARCMPQNPFMIATKTVMAEVGGRLSADEPLAFWKPALLPS